MLEYEPCSSTDFNLPAPRTRFFKTCWILLNNICTLYTVQYSLSPICLKCFEWNETHFKNMNFFCYFLVEWFLKKNPTVGNFCHIFSEPQFNKFTFRCCFLTWHRALTRLTVSLNGQKHLSNFFTRCHGEESSENKKKFNL